MTAYCLSTHTSQDAEALRALFAIPLTLLYRYDALRRVVKKRLHQIKNGMFGSYIDTFNPLSVAGINQHPHASL